MNFNKIVKDVIGLILDLYGFVLKNESNGIVEYENKVLVISFTYDLNVSFEVDVDFYFKANDESYNLAEINEYFFQQKNKFIANQILDDEQLKLWLFNVKVMLSDNMQFLIKNHEMICFELENLRLKNIDYYYNNQESKFFHQEIKRFWDENNYIGLVELVKKYNGNIDGTLKKKYEYALKKIKI